MSKYASRHVHANLHRLVFGMASRSRPTCRQRELALRLAPEQDPLLLYHALMDLICIHL